MAELRPFRDYDEKDVINLYALDLTGIDLSAGWDSRVSHGTLVKLSANGWKNDDEIEMLGEAGTMTIPGVVHERYGVKAKVEVTAANTDAVLGMTLFHVAERDENGEQLKFNPRKASELEACIAGQAVPLVTRGIFLIEDATLATALGAASAGTKLAPAANGGFEVHGGNETLVGKTLGDPAGNLVLIKLEL
jgi:hypothetical protein